MSEDMLRRLTNLSDRLNQASDLLNDRFADVEAALAGLKLGIFAWVVMSRWEEITEPKDGNGARYAFNHYESLGYGKHRGKWGLLLQTGCDEFPDRDHVQFLRDAPRRTRLAAVDKLDALLKALVESAEEFAEEANTKAGKAQQFASKLTAQ